MATKAKQQRIALAAPGFAGGIMEVTPKQTEGNFAITPRMDSDREKTWRVTHIPTGYAVAKELPLARARVLMHALAGEFAGLTDKDPNIIQKAPGFARACVLLTKYPANLKNDDMARDFIRRQIAIGKAKACALASTGAENISIREGCAGQGVSLATWFTEGDYRCWDIMSGRDFWESWSVRQIYFEQTAERKVPWAYSPGRPDLGAGAPDALERLRSYWKDTDITRAFYGHEREILPVLRYVALIQDEERRDFRRKY